MEVPVDGADEEADAEDVAQHGRDHGFSDVAPDADVPVAVEDGDGDEEHVCDYYGRGRSAGCLLQKFWFERRGRKSLFSVSLPHVGHVGVRSTVSGRNMDVGNNTNHGPGQAPRK